MASSVTVKVEGLSELGRRMAALSADVSLKIARSATAAAAGIVKKGAVANIVASPSVVTGSLRDDVIIKRLSKRESNLTSEHIVTVRGRGKSTKKTAKDQKSRNAPHAHFVEFGTVNMPAEPFLQPAFETHKQAALEAMKDRLQRRIIKAEK